MTLSQLQILEPMYARYHLGKPIAVTNAVRLALASRSLTDLRPSDFFNFDQEHFLGLSPLEEYLTSCQPDHDTEVLDIGSGLGGPARYIASKAGSTVLGLEVQPDRVALARQLTALVGLSDRVRFETQDFGVNLQLGRRFGSVISLLAILHIPNKVFALRSVADSLLPGGTFFLEDYVAPRDLTQHERAVLSTGLACPSLLSKEQYLDELAANGLVVKKMQRMTPEWGEFVRQRYAGFASKRPDFLRFLTKDQVNDLDGFFKDVVSIYDNGLVDGYRISGVRRA